MVKNVPRISVVMAVYNDEKYIGQCVESILNQTFSDFEFIIIDDGSVDSTVEIIEKYRLRDKRIVFLKNEKNKGIAYSRNMGEKKASSEYIAVIDSDDVAVPERLEKQFDFLSSNEKYGGCGGFQIHIDDNGDPIKIREASQKEGEITDLLHDPCQLSHSTCMFRREVFKSMGGYRESFERGVDYDFFLRVCEKYRIYNISRTLIEQRFSLIRGTIRERAKQLCYVELARRLASQRKDGGQDCLQKGDIKAFEKIKKEVFGPQWRPRWMEVSSNYFYWAHRMYHRGPLDYAKRLVKESVKHNPLNLMAVLYMAFLYSGRTVRGSLTAMKRFFVR